MRIMHVNVGNHAGPVDGVAAVAARLAADQAAAGHDVRLVVAADPAHHDQVRAAAGKEVTTMVTAGAREALREGRRLLTDPAGRPDVVHLHSVFRPAHRVLAGYARRAGVPYVLTPHSGLAPALLRRDRIRKGVYGRLVERAFYRRADGVHALQQVEHDDVVAYSRRTRPIRVIPNSVPADLVDLDPWSGGGETAGEGERRPRVVLLCRYDVYQKGLDRLAEIAALAPDVVFEVYGSTDKNQPEAAEELMATAPENLRFEAPVHGDDKIRTLRGADLFLQPSRVEGLSVALAEAMTLGVPCGVSGYVADTLAVRDHGTALVLHDEAPIAAGQITSLLRDRRRLTELGRAARSYALRELRADVVSRRHLDHYATLVQDRP